MDTSELADGGILLYQDAFLSPDVADRYFVDLRDTSAWEQKKGTFGHLQPRLTASYGDEGVTYFYSGTENRALPWTPTLFEIKRRIEVGKSERINFAFNRIERTPNTLDAHRLIWLADKQGVQEAVVEAVFRAYFTEGRDIGNRQTLIDVVAEAGLVRGKAEATLNCNDGLEAIREADELSRRFRVEGVPFFIVNGKFTLSGAQQPDAFLEAFRQAEGVL